MMSERWKAGAEVAEGWGGREGVSPKIMKEKSEEGKEGEGGIG